MGRLPPQTNPSDSSASGRTPRVRLRRRPRLESRDLRGPDLRFQLARMRGLLPRDLPLRRCLTCGSRASIHPPAVQPPADREEELWVV